MLLHLVVQRWICRKRRALVNFNKPWSKVFVNHNIKAQNLKAHGVIEALRLTNSVHVIHVRLSSNHSLDDDVLYLSHDLVGVCSLWEKDLENGEQRSFVAFFFISIVVVLFVVVSILTVFFGLLIVLSKLCVHFVNCVVGEMYKHVVQVSIAGFLVWLSGKSSKALLMDEDAQRVEAIEQNVYS